MDRREKATEAFRRGYNCSQAVVLAFEDLLPMDRKTLLTMSSSFGAGIGRMREVCGAVSGIMIVIGILYGYDDSLDRQAKVDHYRRIQDVAGRFLKKRRTLICRELLNLPLGWSDPVPEPRTERFYTDRPCIGIIGDAAEILERYIGEYPPERLTDPLP